MKKKLRTVVKKLFTWLETIKFTIYKNRYELLHDLPHCTPEAWPPESGDKVLFGK